MKRAVNIDYITNLTFVVKTKRHDPDLDDFVLGLVQTCGLGVNNCADEWESGSRGLTNTTRGYLSKYSVSPCHFQMTHNVVFRCILQSMTFWDRFRRAELGAYGRFGMSAKHVELRGHRRSLQDSRFICAQNGAPNAANSDVTKT